ncbi:amidohydrolase family protein [Niabella soli]|uniref:Amidohydrolase n=1 Tax=Niabella soli DSM 19437 TaxID=929713 RepID=W0EUM4_9BACT|nr:amidohydrolase family protein [Niabella soli]AHF14515.1 amidohydrolase [Niabella soli DSM 19437]
MNRRKFVTNTASSGAGLMLGSLLAGASYKQKPSFDGGGPRRNFMQEVLKYRKIDTHAHADENQYKTEVNLDFADRLGISKLMISNFIRPFSEGTPDDFRSKNNFIIKCMKAHPDRFIGTVALNPAFKKESLEEIDRCRDAGMTGLGELYNQVKIDDPLYYPIIEKCIDLNWNIMMHSPVGYSRVKLYPAEPKNISLPEDFASIAKRYPEALFQFAHIGGGIDWEYACKVLKESPNVFIEVSGSNNAAGMIDFALKCVGEDRLVFGCDYSFYQGVGHLFSANLTDAQRKKIFFENIAKRLKKAGVYVN